MDTLQRLQPLDFLFAIVWAAIVGWGLQTGVVRQLGMLVGVYAAALLSGSLYRQGGAALALAFGRESLPQLEFVAYVALFVLVFGVIGVLIWRAYPASKLSRGFGTENVIGAALGAIWGVLLLIAVLTILRFFSVVPWKGEESSQQGIAHQVQLSQVAPVLEVVASPLWQVMAPWFPSPVPPRL
jgi:Colicin V production protein